MLIRFLLTALGALAAMVAVLCGIGLGIALIIATVYHSLRVLGVIHV